MSSLGRSLKNRDFERTSEGVCVKHRALYLIIGCVNKENGLDYLTLQEEGSSMVSFNKMAI